MENDLEKADLSDEYGFLKDSDYWRIFLIVKARNLYTLDFRFEKKSNFYENSFAV